MLYLSTVADLGSRPYLGRVYTVETSLASASDLVFNWSHTERLSWSPGIAYRPKRAPPVYAHALDRHSTVLRNPSVSRVSGC
jgi:hypothetical protein